MALWGGVGLVDTQVVQLCGPGGLLGWNPGVGLLRGVLRKGHHLAVLRDHRWLDRKYMMS